MLQLRILFCIGFYFFLSFDGWTSNEESEKRGIKRVATNELQSFASQKSVKNNKDNFPDVVNEPLYTDSDVQTFASVYSKIREKIVAESKLVKTLRAEFTNRHIERFPELKDKSSKKLKIKYAQLSLLIQDLEQLKIGVDETFKETACDFEEAQKFDKLRNSLRNIKRSVAAATQLSLILSKYNCESLNQFKNEYAQVKRATYSV